MKHKNIVVSLLTFLYSSFYQVLLRQLVLRRLLLRQTQIQLLLPTRKKMNFLVLMLM